MINKDCASGVTGSFWSWSGHPPYFGDQVVSLACYYELRVLVLSWGSTMVAARVGPPGIRSFTGPCMSMPGHAGDCRGSCGGPGSV